MFNVVEISYDDRNKVIEAIEKIAENSECDFKKGTQGKTTVVGIADENPNNHIAVTFLNNGTAIIKPCDWGGEVWSIFPDDISIKENIDRFVFELKKKAKVRIINTTEGNTIEDMREIRLLPETKNRREE
jgi:hypothetical protein